jgi:hypothetical protein
MLYTVLANIIPDHAFGRAGGAGAQEIPATDGGQDALRSEQLLPGVEVSGVSVLWIFEPLAYMHLL